MSFFCINKSLCRFVGILTVVTLLAVSSRAVAQVWRHDQSVFAERLGEGLGLDEQGRLSPIGGQRGGDAVYTSAVLQTDAAPGLSFIGWITNVPIESHALRVELRTADAPFHADAPDNVVGWQPVQNGQTRDLPQGRYFQYRVFFRRDGAGVVPNLREVLLSTESLRERFDANPISPESVYDRTMAMMYSATPEKLFQFYDELPYTASERGIYILRNREGVPITPETWQYVPNGPEMYLPMRFGIPVFIRIHPEATFSPLTLHPKDVVVRDKHGNERNAPHAQYRAINFFDESFMREYLNGVRLAVRYYHEDNPYVLGYNIMPPEFFYDTEPWPQMTYLGGFGRDALRSYRAFMKRIGENVQGWPALPAISDGRISDDSDYYLWAWWRFWAGANYIDSVARVIREENPQAQVGTLSYVGDQGLRGGEAAFIERNPNLDFYYSSNMFPRVPGPNGWDGGTIFSYTRLNPLGQSVKRNFVEFDVWSPYVDMQRARTYARYVQAEGLYPVPIVFGNYPQGKASDHLTRYHGMKGDPMTPEVFDEIHSIIEATAADPQGRKQSDVAYVMPSVSLTGLLEKDAWKSHRYVQKQHHIFGELLGSGVTFDLLTEGQLTPEICDKYKLIIVPQPVIYPWMRKALEQTSATVLATGWAGTIAAPGPDAVSLDVDSLNFEKTLTSAWPEANEEIASTTIFPTGGKVVEGTTTIDFADSCHPLLRGLQSARIVYEGLGLDEIAAGQSRNDRTGLPYVRGLGGTALASDAEGFPVLSVYEADGKRLIHLGALLYYLDPDGKDKALFTPEQSAQFWRNVFDYSGVLHHDLPPALHVMKTNEGLIVENRTAEPYLGPAPRPAALGDAAQSVETEIEIEPFGTVFLRD